MKVLTMKQMLANSPAQRKADLEASILESAKGMYAQRGNVNGPIHKRTMFRHCKALREIELSELDRLEAVAEAARSA